MTIAKKHSRFESMYFFLWENGGIFQPSSCDREFSGEYPETMHYSKGNGPLKFTIDLYCLIPLKIGNSMTPVDLHSISPPHAPNQASIEGWRLFLASVD